MPVLAGSAYLLGNLLVMNPMDPLAFYHVRYVLPAVPLLLVAATVGASRLGKRLSSRTPWIPAAVLLLLSTVGLLTTVVPESRHLHNDVRNINEVQRRMADWMAAYIPAGPWVAASDAGAIRYFSKHPTIDVLGLNTPEMLKQDEKFIRSHPVAVLALMGPWFRPVGDAPIAVYFWAQTENYTVTSNPHMANQLIVGLEPRMGPSPVRVRFQGMRQFELDFLPIPSGLIPLGGSVGLRAPVH
jgi:hypothetical protein